MPDAHGRTTEFEISEVVLDILNNIPTGRATFRALIRGLNSRLPLTLADQVISETRPTERLWEQRVRNISSHRKAEGNFISEGYLIKINGGLQITESGKRRVTRRN